MLIKSITFPTSFKDYGEEQADIENTNIDVFVESSEGYTYTIVAITPKNLQYLMDKEKMNYLEPGYPFIIVQKITEEIIIETLKAYAEDDAYWLKLYHFAGKIDATVFDKLQAEHIEHLKELDELEKLDELDRLNNS